MESIIIFSYDTSVELHRGSNCTVPYEHLAACVVADTKATGRRSEVMNVAAREIIEY